MQPECLVVRDPRIGRADRDENGIELGEHVDELNEAVRDHRDLAPAL